MGDYPLGSGRQGEARRGRPLPGRRERRRRSTTSRRRFSTGWAFPPGVLPWRQGVLVACAPDIFYAEDRDGDGKADIREVLFTGFTEGNQQHRLNGFELGLDGWVYGANGDSGGSVRSLKTGKQTSINGRDFRFRPDTGEFEAESGQTQYGRHRDDWGHWFGNNNPNWALALRAGRPRPEAQHESTPPPDPRQTLEPDTRLFPMSRTLARFNDLNMAGRVTSANSATPYRDELFGPWFASSIFVSEPVHNLVHRIVLEPDGATFRGHRGPDELDREFLASSDNWFRPTMLKTGPDGALWIADMYRLRHRASGVDSRRLGTEARPAGRKRAGEDLSGLSGRQEAAADSSARQAGYDRPGRRVREPQRLAARHGPASVAAPPRPGSDRAAAQARA